MGNGGSNMMYKYLVNTQPVKYSIISFSLVWFRLVRGSGVVQVKLLRLVAWQSIQWYRPRPDSSTSFGKGPESWCQAISDARQLISDQLFNDSKDFLRGQK